MDIIPERYPLRSRSQSKSYGQYALGRLIRNIYGQVVILEEFPVPDERLFLDFYLPHHNLVFEYHGVQHDQFNKFFHVNQRGFQNSQARDGRKKQWCEINDIVLVEVRGSPTSQELQVLIQDARKHE